ncbi:hypothetical protein [Marinomonas transparens]|uniref:Uncharacterized protein n=1 Tax=Marinomonas transparens TaxID=2795388 RepID=A0A934JU79_9GAMM|nr:hypothetical protein [Marinomonas transparens]MBJ7538416.1 hypothetical protein [Marinomonas transparens]
MLLMVMYGVYHQYESDHTGYFSVLPGAEPSMLEANTALEKALLPAGEDLAFLEKAMPEVVIDVYIAVMSS